MFDWIDAFAAPSPLDIVVLGMRLGPMELGGAAVAILAAAAYGLAAARARACAGGRLATLHSRPGDHGLYALMWTALIGFGALIVAGGLTGAVYLADGLTQAVAAAFPEMTEVARSALANDVSGAAAGDPASLAQITGDPAREALLADHMARANKRAWLVGGVAVALALLTVMITVGQINRDFRARNRSERLIRGLLAACAAAAIATTLGIVFSVVGRTAQFLGDYPIDPAHPVSALTGVLTRVGAFLTGLEWAPLDAVQDGALIPNDKIGAVPLFAGTLMITGVAMMIAGPIGLMAAVYLSDYASKRVRAVAKPLLEVLAGVPTVVYGFFAAITVAPAVRALSETNLPVLGPIGLWLGSAIMSLGAFVILWGLIALSRSANAFRVYGWIFAVVCALFALRILAFHDYSLGEAAVTGLIAFIMLMGVAVVVRSLAGGSLAQAAALRRISVWGAAAGCAGLFVYLILQGDAPASSESALAAGLVMGIMIIPFVSSLSDDIINATPQALRDGSLGLGATQAETITRVVLPTAMPGIVSALLLGVSRAVGETMIVVMAASMTTRLTANPLDSVTTVTVQIVALITGDTDAETASGPAYSLAFALIVATLLLNVIALRIVRKYRETYA